MVRWVIPDAVGFAKLIEQFDADLAATPGAGAALATWQRMEEMIVLEGADMTQLFRRLSAEHDDNTMRRVREQYEAWGWDAEGY